MTKCSETDKVTIWNPVTGSFFLKDDDSCPILDVCALVSRKVSSRVLAISQLQSFGIDKILSHPLSPIHICKNVYGNIQEEGKPKCTCFNIQDTRYWLPLHTRTDYEYYPLPTSDQSCHLSYTVPNQAYSLDLELEIEKALQIFFWSSRRVPTIFNSTSSESLCKMLHDLEERKFNGIAIPSSPDYYFKFTEKRSSGKQIFGFALHFTYYKTDEIVEKVKSTALHQSKHPDVEFSIAVKVFPYACNLFSAWVCILSEMPPHQCFD
jgi:coiled-coil and C2 domain-containing protein 2A